MNIRSSGILLPVFSLPSRFGIGDFGPAAYRFADFLKQTGQQVWQILPLTPTTPAHSHSPYYCPSAFALNPLLVSPEMLAKDGWVKKTDIQNPPKFNEDRIDYRRVAHYKSKLMALAYQHFQEVASYQAYDAFCAAQQHWLADYALYAALKAQGKKETWNQWPDDIRLRRRKALRAYTKNLADAIQENKFYQFLAFTQWHRLKKYCNARHIHIFGDMPIYVPYDSADVWSNRSLFKLDRDYNPSKVSGVPPDYFSKTGQRWGHPVYRWPAHEKSGFKWWMDRMAHNLSLFDLVRIDHFRGFVACWEIPASEKTAVNGRWVPGPVHDFFSHLLRRFIHPPIIAEDLGLITPDVREILHQYALPGMRVLLFGFSGNLKENPNAFHNIPSNAVAYTGTHDTNTVRGWFASELSESEQKQLFSYLGRTISKEEVAWELVRMAMMSPAKMVIIPLQDILGLGKDARINRPAKIRGNWQWRVTRSQMTAIPESRLFKNVQIFGRA